MSAQGAVLDPDGIPLNSTTSDNLPSVSAMGTTWLVTWSGWSSPSSNVYATRVGAGGGLLDAQPIKITSGTYSYGHPSAATSGNEWLIAWQYQNTSTYTDYVAYARMAPDGTLLDATPKNLASSATLPEVLWNGSQYVVAFRGTSYVRTYRVTTAGIASNWTANLDSGSASEPAMATDGTVFLLAAATSQSTGLREIIGSVYDNSSAAFVGTHDMLLSRGANVQKYPAVAWNGSVFLVVWQDLRPAESKPDIFGARLDAAGHLLDPSGIAISIAAGTQQYPAVASDGDQFLVVWSDLRTTYGAYSTRVSGAGQVLDPNGVRLSTWSSSSIEAPGVGFNGTEFLAVWPGYNTMTGTRVSKAGVPLDAAGLSFGGAGTHAAPSVTSNGSEFFVAWHTGTSPSLDVNAVRLSALGYPIGTGPFMVAGGTGAQAYPSVACNGSGYLVVWEDGKNGTADVDVYGARVSATGAIVAPGAFPIGAAPKNQTTPRLAWDGAKYTVVWADTRDASYDIFATQIDPAGVVLQPAGIMVSANAHNEIQPAIASGPAGASLVVYDRFVAAADMNTVRVMARVISDLLSPGEPCTSASECASGYCVDSLCCSSACGNGAADCQACNLPGALGTCTKAASGTPCRAASGLCDEPESCTGNDTFCPADLKKAAGTECRPAAGACDSAEACDGVQAACPADEVLPAVQVCRLASCVNGVATEAASCDGATASCPAIATHACSPYACGAGVCKSSCANTSDCASGMVCENQVCILFIDAGPDATDAPEPDTGPEPGDDASPETGTDASEEPSTQDAAESDVPYDMAIDSAAETEPEDAPIDGVEASADAAEGAALDGPQDGAQDTSDVKPPDVDTGDGNAGADGSAGAAGNAGGAVPEESGGCGCKTKGQPHGSYPWIAMSCAAALLRRRRRRVQELDRPQTSSCWPPSDRVTTVRPSPSTYA